MMGATRILRYHRDMQRGAILKAALDLPEDDRRTLVEDLEASMNGGFASPEIEEAWGAEIERRIEEIDSGKVKTIPWREVQTEIRALLERRRAR